MNRAQWRVLMLVALAPGYAGMGLVSHAWEATGEESGQAVFLDRERGHCLLCHRVRQIDEPFQGSVGPDLSDVGSRLSLEQIRERIVDPTRFNPHTVMPAYHRVENLRQVAPRYRGLPILSEAEVDAVVRFVAALRMPREGPDA